MTAYDETRLHERVSALPPLARAVFAASCSQRLVAMCAVLGEAWEHPVPEVFEATQEAVWAMCAGLRGADDADELDAAISAEVPHDDDEDWDRLSGYLQSAGIASIHAVLAVPSANPAHAVFAARQLCEVADSTASDLRDAGDGAAAADVLHAATRALEDDLASLEAEIDPAVERIRQRAVHEGRQLAARLLTSLPADD